MWPLRTKINRLVVRIITAKEEWLREAPYEIDRPIWLLGAQTLRQLDSPQWLLSRGFRKA